MPLGIGAVSRPQYLRWARVIAALLAIYGFFPTTICTALNVPGCTFTFVSGCAGKTFEEMARLRTIAAPTGNGIFSKGRAWSDVSCSLESTDIWTPVPKPAAIGVRGFPSSSGMSIMEFGNGPGDPILVHPARCKILFICWSRYMLSSSAKTEMNAYWVPLNGANVATTWSSWSTDLGDTLVDSILL